MVSIYISYGIGEYNGGMGRQIRLEAHLEIKALEKGYRATVDGRERSHWQMIWLLAQGKSTAEVAELTGYSAPWVREVVHRYNAQGEQVLSDSRHRNPGRGCIFARLPVLTLYHHTFASTFDRPAEIPQR